MKKIISKLNLFSAIISGLIIAVFITDNVAYANDLSQVTTGLETLKTLVMSVIAAIGVIIVAKEVSELSTAMKQQDSAGVSSSIKGIIGGALMISVGGVVALFT